MMTEKKLMLQILQLYKGFPCLWDNREILYSNKEAREKAYEVLFEKYRLISDDCTMHDLKKKLENMRTTFRREHKKVLMSRMNGGPDYTPNLWYYDKLLFLNEISQYNFDSSANASAQGSDETPPHPKRKKYLSVYVPEKIEQNFNEDNDEIDDDDEDDEEGNKTHDIFRGTDEDFEGNEMNMPRTAIEIEVPRSTKAAKAFGAVIGLQLESVDDTQRAIAEKLISDVVFYARMNKLTCDATVVTDKNRNC